MGEGGKESSVGPGTRLESMFRDYSPIFTIIDMDRHSASNLSAFSLYSSSKMVKNYSNTLL